MTEKFFLYPFATSGETTSIPDAVQTDGSVSMEEGFGPNYSADQETDSLAKDVPRETFNQLMFWITEAIRQIQTASVPSFITAAANGGTSYSYAKNVRVQYDDGGGNKIYQSLADANTALPTDATKWQEVTANTTVPDATTLVKGIVELATSSEAMAGTDTTRAVTSSGLASSKNLVNPGFMGFPGGFKVCFGTATFNSTGIANITFNSPFTSSCLGIVANRNNATITTLEAVGFGSISVSGATAYNGQASGSSGVSFSYMAWGI